MIDSHAVIMAGGNGKRFWPLSTPEKPKQFLDLFSVKTLIRHAVDRLEGFIFPERIYVITAERFADLTRESLPMLPSENVIGETCRRDTAAAVATDCGLVLQKGGSYAVGCILTADQLIEPADVFRATLADAVTMAAREDAIVTMGILPTRPETGFGYIECGANLETGTKTVFHAVRRIVEKPNLQTAKFYLANGGFLWNSGIFVWSALTIRNAFWEHAPYIAPIVDAVATSSDISATIRHFYPCLRAISIDFAVMEHAEKILVAESRFTWDDVGSWTAVEYHFPANGAGNTVVWQAHLFGDSSAIVLNDDPKHKQTCCRRTSGSRGSAYKERNVRLCQITDTTPDEGNRKGRL